MQRGSKLKTVYSLNEQANAEHTLTRRTAILGAGALGAFGILGARLYNLQVINAENYISLSEDNRFNYNMLLPSRGQILDRYGEALAVNIPNYRVVLIPERTADIDGALSAVSDIIKLDAQDLKRIKRDIKANPKFVPITVQDNVEWEEFAALNMRIYDFPGLVPEVAEGRAYPNEGVFAHTLGFIGRASARDVETDDDPLLRQPTFRIGKTGIESTAEKTLRGSSGRLKVEVNAIGRIVREWPDPKDAAKPGKDVYLTLDADLQKFAAKEFGEDSGGIAVIDCMTGELRTLLSMPSFDANLFVNGLTQNDMDRLNNDPRRPQFNKVIGGGYPPASTYKMAVMLAALESDLINEEGVVFCVGKLKVGNRTFHCWKRDGHGPMNLKDALKYSCDTLFYELAQIVGPSRIADMARRLGLGQKYGIGLAGEKAGIVPDEAWKRQRLGAGWRTGDSLNASIGQGFVLATPLQLAVMTARIANGVDAITPSLLIGEDFVPFDKMDINPIHLQIVREAMYSVCEEPGGTAYLPNGLGLDGIKLAGKTGTGQVRGISSSERAAGVRQNFELPWELRDHSIFVGYAPYESPRFAIGTLVEHGGSGAGRAADITRKVMAEALKRDGLGPRSEMPNKTQAL